MVEVFREVRRVLRKDGVVWLNLGDTYMSSKGRSGSASADIQDQRYRQGTTLNTRHAHIGGKGQIRPQDRRINGLKPKDLVGIPWMVAFALREDGWWLRMDNVWSKKNSMPESTTDRTTRSHEYVFLLTKSKKYFFDHHAIRETSRSNHKSGNGYKRSARLSYQNKDGSPRGNDNEYHPTKTRNRRSVWNINLRPFKEAHFATFPPELPEICIRAGTSERGCCHQCGVPYRRLTKKSKVRGRNGRNHTAADTGVYGKMGSTSALKTGYYYIYETIGWQQGCQCPVSVPVACTVLDPFGGAGTTGLVATALLQNAILIDLNPKYCEMARQRIEEIYPLFSKVSIDIPAWLQLPAPRQAG